LLQQQQQATLQALLGQGQGALQGVQGLGSLASTLGQAGQQQLQGLQAGAQFGALPYQTATTSGQNALNALTQQQNLGNAQYQLPQQVLNDLQSYLGLGQSAASIGGQLGALGAQQQQQNLGNIGGLAALSSPALFGSQGLGGALGISPTSGLLGGGLAGLGLGSLFGAAAPSSIPPALDALSAGLLAF
jgi:hypothetical protein